MATSYVAYGEGGFRPEQSDDNIVEAGTSEDLEPPSQEARDATTLDELIQALIDAGLI